ncbi:ATP-binding cassette domain-containing protein [Betaproteobacteria bacterium PRO7]|jgi:ATP-binding cassette subfamily F protein 3|nr:ATP-binding cassette domain-containing protein [Betaproteobacteria bacterium PRO7]GIL04602.1 MAG: ABC transporter ATP-binding protein [Betaproteobacteria bacterium]
MLRLTDLALARGARVLYRNVSLIAPPGERIGLVGANGSGKSSLFAAILRELAPEAGSLEAPKPERIAHVAQDIEAADESALDYVLAGHAPLMAARAELQTALAGHDDLALAHAHAALAELNEGAIVAQAKAVMHGLGFAERDAPRRVSEFSGGWRNRLALARALLRPADLLLLDEPTNHLDLDSVIWLEAWLRRQDATVLLISHDREFLDRCATAIWHVADGTIRRYAGNYSAFESAWIEQQRQQDAAAKAYERTAAHLQRFVDRFRAKATKARQAQSRIKMLERLQAVEPMRARREWRFEFLEPRKLPERLIDAEDLRLAYPTADGERTILDGVKFLVRSGDRIGILGVNGAGKSTLVKAIAGELDPAAGELRRGAGLAIGYFAQHQLDQLRPDESSLQHLRRLAPDAREQELRDFLGTYRFSGEMATNPVGPMSGGEKARCALALLAWRRPNLLVLDEPTNHLDMETREALTVALSSFEGALLLVSHDRHLLRATVDQLWLVHDGRLASFDGDLDDYAALVLASRRERAECAADDQGPNRREVRKQEAQERQRLAAARKPLQTRLAKLEGEIARISDALRELDARLADPDFYHSGQPDEVAATLKQRGELAQQLESLESRWLELTEQIESIA